MNISFLLHPTFFKHSPGYGHPEDSSRLEVLLKWLKDKHPSSIVDTTQLLPSSKKEISAVHAEELWDLVQSSQQNPIAFTLDTQSNEGTFAASVHATAAAWYAAEHSTVNNSFFALVRPPGHHATYSTAMGFCYFNNISFAASKLLKSKPNSKIAIIDFDNHYGNGTADLFYNNPNVLYISIHGDPRYCFPGRGFVDDVGLGDGKGFNIALPLLPRSGDGDIKMLFDEIILPTVLDFKPDIIGVSAGFDGYENDPLGILGITMKGFEFIGRRIALNLGKEQKIPVFHVLEGGYNIQALPGLLESYVQPYFKDSIGYVKEEPTDSTKNLCKRSKSILSDYWNI